jgi:hypothetical protein
MKKSLREQATEAAAKVGAVTQIAAGTIQGIDETLYVARLSIEERAGVADTGHKPGRRSNVEAALNLLFLAVVKPERIDDKLQPYMTRQEWSAWAGEHPETFTRLSLAVQEAQGDASAEKTVALGKD